jgi:hypothetical protein
MVCPAVRLHQLYSLNLYNGLDIIFENLEMVDKDNLAEVINTKNYDRIEIVDKLFVINTINRTMTIVGNKINDTTYIINKAGNGDIMILNYNCEKEHIISGIEYLYHICTRINKV